MVSMTTPHDPSESEPPPRQVPQPPTPDSPELTPDETNLVDLFSDDDLASYEWRA